MWAWFLHVGMQIIMQKNGKSRGFAFVTMEIGDAQAAIDKFNSHSCPFSFLSLCFSFLFVAVSCYCLFSVCNLIS